MLRNLGVGRSIGFLFVAASVFSTSFAMGQDDAPRGGSNRVDTTPLDPGITPLSNQRIDRGSLTRPELHAAAVGSDGEPVDPRIETLLEDWSKHNSAIKRLQGFHVRKTCNFEFGQESWARGQFYVEPPDKGRLDLEPIPARRIKEKKSTRVGPKGRNVQLEIVPDKKRERWVCDGKELKVINDDDRTYDAVMIPPEQRGENIMDGPLPFLFAMPPEKAKARYRFKFLGEDQKGPFIEARPKLRKDAMDWSRAQLHLDRKTYLPIEVRLYDAAGTTETIFLFADVQINRLRMFWENPFSPSLTFYKRSVHNQPAGPGLSPAKATRWVDSVEPPVSTTVDPAGANTMPSLIGAPYKPVKKQFEDLGHKVVLRRGVPAPAPAKVYHIQEQQPLPGTLLTPNSEIILTLYDKAVPQSDNRAPETRIATKPSGE